MDLCKEPIAEETLEHISESRKDGGTTLKSDGIGHHETGVTPESSTGGQTISINFCGSTPFVWRVADIVAARKAGVVGSLVGSLARQPRQNSRLGRPLQLTQEEAQLLGEMGQAEILSSPDLKNMDMAVPELVQQHQLHMEQSYMEQSQLALEERKAVLRRIMEEKQRDERSDQPVRHRLLALESSFSFPRTAMAVQLSTARAHLGYDPEEQSFLAVASLRPRDERGEARFRVFRDLRGQGFYLTSAGKFGGDYLVYPGDPLRFHAHFIAVCLPMDAQMPLCDLLALSRLGANVKKTVLLCSPGNEEDKVVYTSLQWSGMV